MPEAEILALLEKAATQFMLEESASTEETLALLSSMALPSEAAAVAAQLRQTAAANLAAGGSWSDAELRGAFEAGLDRLRILPADVSTGQRTAISAGKYLGRRLFVEVITDGQGYSATRAEYQVTRWLSLLSSISTIGRTSANVRVSRDY